MIAGSEKSELLHTSVRRYGKYNIVLQSKLQLQLKLIWFKTQILIFYNLYLIQESQNLLKVYTKRWVTVPSERNLDWGGCSLGPGPFWKKKGCGHSLQHIPPPPPPPCLLNLVWPLGLTLQNIMTLKLSFGIVYHNQLYANVRWPFYYFAEQI